MESSKVILYSSPEMGHIVSMVELGKLIHTNHPSLSILILLVHAPYVTDSTVKFMSTVAANNPSITFHHLPVIALPPDISSDHIDLAFDIPKLYNPVFHDILVTILEHSTIKAVILDFFSNEAFEVSKSLDLPTYYFFIGSTYGLCSLLYLSTINKTTTKNIKDLDNFMEIPGIHPIHSSCMPSFLFVKESNSYKNFLKTANNMAKSSGIIGNSFFELEERAVQTLRDGKCITDCPTPPIYLVGPLIKSGSQVSDNENECLKWLNTQPSKSVVFLSFGSMGVHKKDQLKEIAVGLERSGQRFLWVVRNPPSESSSGAKLDFSLDDILPEGFITRTRDTGLVVKNWAPQPAILSHESVGGFVSHCGWNSSLEAIVSGVPMVAWPLAGDQFINRVHLVEEIKVAVSLTMSANGFVTADAVEEAIIQLMDVEAGKTVRERMSKMSGKAKTVVEDGGSSRVDFLNLSRSWTDL